MNAAPARPSLQKRLLYWYFAVRNAWPVWFYVLNARARKLHRARSKPVEGVARQVVHDLEASGIAITSLSELFPGEDVLARLQAYVGAHANNARSYSKKQFLKDYWELVPDLDLQNPFVELVLRPEVLAIANAYMRMWTRLNYYHLATIEPSQGDEISSQRWHRDNEDPRMCKMFVYVNDVDETSGPFIYVQGSAPTSRGPYANLFPQRKPEGSYPPKEAVEAAVDPKDIRTFTGKAGTVLFCDTTGLHKGGHATQRARTMFTSFYTSDAWTEAHRYRIPPTALADLETRPPEVKYALFLDHDLTK